MPWACSTTLVPIAAPVAPAVALPVPPHRVHRGVGHRARRHMMKSWGASHAAAVVAWRGVVTCVWVAGVAGAGGAGLAAVPPTAGVFPPEAGAPGAPGTIRDVVCCAEPGPLLIFVLAVLLIIMLSRRTQVMTSSYAAGAVAPITDESWDRWKRPSPPVARGR